MHELQRRAYLEAMGITTYVSKAPVPGAAPSRKLVLVPTAIPAESEPVPSAPPDAVKSPLADIELSKRPQANPEPTLAPAKMQGNNAPSFSMVAFALEQTLWLELLADGQAVMSDQVHLVQAMSQALAWGQGRPEVSQFNWPIHTNKQLDIGEVAAKASLAGFINRKLEPIERPKIVILGNDAKQWLALQQLESVRLISTVGTRQMLQNPALKRQAWQDLKSYLGQQ